MILVIVEVEIVVEIVPSSRLRLTLGHDSRSVYYLKLLR
jgi:hypothetical protein